MARIIRRLLNRLLDRLADWAYEDPREIGGIRD